MKSVDQLKLQRFAPLIALAVLAIMAFLALQMDTVLALELPTRSDQDSNLLAAQAFRVRYVLDAKAPLYSGWLGFFSTASPDSAWQTLINEKVASLLLLSFGIACLGYLIHSFVTGVFLLLWMANLKYVALEPNGSNAFAAIIVIYGMILLLTVPRRWRPPAGVLTLFLAALARPEFKAILLAFVFWIAGIWLYGAFRARSFRLERADIRRWLLVVLVMAGSGAAVRSRLADAPFPTVVAIHDGFAVTYFHRKHLESEFSSGWGATQEIWLRAFPRLDNYLDRSTSQLLRDMWRENPREVSDHLIFNARRTLVTTTAVALGFHSRALMLFALAICIVYMRTPRRSCKRCASCSVPGELWAMAACTLLILPVAVLILPQWRYFIPVLPGIMVATGVLLCRSTLWRGVRRDVVQPARQDVADAGS